MGAVKQAMLEQAEKEMLEPVAECQSCGGDVTAEQLAAMPYDGGEPVFVYCEKCMEEYTK